MYHYDPLWNLIDFPTYIFHVENSSYSFSLLFSIIKPNSLLVCSDVTSFFTKVSIPDTVILIQDLLVQVERTQEVAILIEKCYTLPNFSFKGSTTNTFLAHPDFLLLLLISSGKYSKS